MNTKLFSLFLVTILGFSAFSASGNGWVTYQNAEYSINLVEDLSISSGFGQEIKNWHKVSLNEQLDVSNHEKYQKLVAATKQITERHAIMDRIAPNTRLRFVQDADLLEHAENMGITDFIEIITDTFYDGGAKTPSLPSIPIAFATNGNSDSLQLLQVYDRYGQELDSVYSDTGPPSIVSKSQNSYSKIFLEDIPNQYQAANQYHITSLDEFSSSITLPELEFSSIVVVISAPATIYIILFSEGVVPGIRPPKIPQSTAFYFVFVFFVFTTFSTPFAIGNNTWGTAYGDMGNSTSTNSTQTNNTENVQFTNTTQIADAIEQFQNSTVTETDNVADGPKHYSVSISDGVTVGDGSPINTNIPEEPKIEEISTDIQISESVSFSDNLGQKDGISRIVEISESVSFSDNLEILGTISEGIIHLIEHISFNEQVEGTFGIGLVRISEEISFGEEIETEVNRSLNVIIDISEAIELSSQIAIDGVAELHINEFLKMTDNATISISTIRINEHIELGGNAVTQFREITLNDISVVNLLPENSTLMLNGTSHLETDRDIEKSVKQFTISAWLKPQFNSATPQMIAVSKDLTFQISINNVAEPQYTPIFRIYDGIKWYEVVGLGQLQEGKWHHIAGVLDNSKITMFIDGKQQGIVSLPELFLVNEQGWLTETEMGISVSDSNIVIGGEFDNASNISEIKSRFSGQISSVLIHNKALDTKFIKEVMENTAPFSTTKIHLTDKIWVSDTQGLSSKEAVSINESISFPDILDSGVIILPKIFTEGIDLIALNGTEADSMIALNGTDYLTIQDTISSEMNTMSISSWIKPEFDTLSTSKERAIPQYAITSKENSFNLYARNFAQPSQTIGFSVFDGIKWNDISGHTVLDENWHHVVASVNGSKIALYVDGNLEGEKNLQNEFSIGKNGQYSITDSQISISNSDIVIGAYVSTAREEIKTSDKFVGKIASIDIHTEVFSDEQIAYKYETELSRFYKFVSINETVEIGDQTNLLYELTIGNSKSYEIELHETIELDETIELHETIDLKDLNTITGSDNTVYLDELLIVQETISHTTTAIYTFSINLEEILSFDDRISTGQSSIELDENLSFDVHIIALNPFVPSVHPEIQMVKSGFLITENPKFELEYYSENDAVKIDHQQIVNATSIADQLQEDLASTPSELLTTGDTNEVATAIQVIETRNAILELEDQMEQIPEVIMPEDIKELQEKIEKITESIDETVKKLEETRLEEKAEEIENSAEIIREAADIKQNLNQTGTWETTHETISTRIIAPDGTVFSEEVFYEKTREGKFDIEIAADAERPVPMMSAETPPDVEIPIMDLEYNHPKPGIYTIENTITVGNDQYTINEEFAWGLVSLNTKKSTYYPGDTAEFVIVVLDSVGAPVCDANLVMSINGTTLSSGAGITPNEDCGIYDATFDTNMEGTYHVDISAIANGIQTGFETTFDVADYVEFDIIRTAQSKIDPINNPNEFEVIVDITSHTDASDIQIVETVPSVFGISTDGQTSTENGITTITWNKTLVDDNIQISYTYSVPYIFPDLYPLGGIQINYNGETYNEARPWFVANDPVTVASSVEINHNSDNAPDLTNRQGFGSGIAVLGDMDGDLVPDIAVGTQGWQYVPWDSFATNVNGAIFIMYMNDDGSVKSTVTIDKDTTNGPGSDAGWGYGHSVESLGDLDGDGVTDIAVGDMQEDSTKGKIYIHYLNANGSVKSTAEIKHGTTNGPSLSNGDYYGSGIANMGDLNDDGVIDIAVGAAEDSSAGNDKGAVYIHYMNTDGSIDSTVKINDDTSNGASIQADMSYGWSVENIGDLDGDGVTDMAVGEAGTQGSYNPGLVNIHLMNANGSIKSTTEIIGQSLPDQKSPPYYNHFGSSIANIGDQDADGVNDIAVGSSLDGWCNTHPDCRMGKGGVYVLHMNSDGSVKNSMRINDMTTNGPLSTYFDDNPTSRTFTTNNNGWSCCGDRFGSAVASGDINRDGKLDLLVGAWQDNTVGNLGSSWDDKGAIWTIFYNGAETARQHNLNISETISFSDNISNSFAVDGIHIILLSESLSLADAMGEGHSVSVYITESVSLTDSTVKRTERMILSETISLTETLVKLPNKSFLETLSVIDHVPDPPFATIDGVSTVFLSEVLLLTDNFNRVGSAVRILSDTISFTDAVTAAIDYTLRIHGTKEVTKDSNEARQGFGSGIASLGDLDGNGAMDLAVGATEGDRIYSPHPLWQTNRNGVVYIMYMNTDGSIKSTVEIDKDTANGPGSSATNGYGTEVESLGDMDGDGVPEIAVGSEAEESEKGVIYIHYLNANGSVKSTVKINDATTNGASLTAGDNYGSDIANMGDMDGDGVIDIAVGADEDSSAGNDKGAVYIHYMNANGSIKSTVKINDSTANGPNIYATDLKYGNSVENMGDIDGDGVNDMAVGAPSDTNNKGMAFLHFMNANGSIKSTVNIDGTTLPDDSTHNDWCNCYIMFGTGIANIGDQNNDGVNDMAVGASQYGYGADRDGNGQLDTRMDKGAVFVLNMNANGSVKSSLLIDDKTPNGPAIYGGSWRGQFGSSIEAADIDGNGRLDLIVGATSDISAGEREGSVWTIFINGASYVENTSVDISESISFSVVVGKQTSVELSESLTLTDSISGTKVILISESVALTDTVLLHDRVMGLSESISFSDSVTIGKDVTQSISESISLADTTTSLRSLDLSETITLTDSMGYFTSWKLYSSTEINHNTSNAPDLTNRQGFGASVASLGDMDGDGVTDIAVGTQGLEGSHSSPWDYLQLTSMERCTLCI